MKDKILFAISVLLWASAAILYVLASGGLIKIAAAVKASGVAP